MKQERLNEDNFSLSHSLKCRVKVQTDVKSLLPPAKNHPETVFEQEMTDSAFLHYRRCRSETILIKSKILQKVDKDQPLSHNETAYLTHWLTTPTPTSLLLHHSQVPN